ncbi:multiple stress resistance protein BhsA [Erwinia sp. V71]|uniref:multiple stress resistance protein BhsA n=1 Tax=Erwinia sp. V71 TaxID=3369424 RepID=UPI003F61EF86
MKNVKNAAIAIALSALSFGSFAAELVTSEPLQQQEVGVISATGSSNLTSLQDQLAAKAEQQGAKSFRITSVTGQNQLYGTAVIYK